VTAVSTLLPAIRRGDRRALARAITLTESTRPDHREEAEALLAAALPHTGDSVRIGISGPPGAGKSTFIERFGLDGVACGRQIAVLAVDPASKRGGGAILADKTRMPELARSPSAFIRPSSTGLSRGGASRHTREAILLCEAARFDAVIVESVGVGQSETAVAEMTDMFVLILPPASGDELQGIKRGIVELADLVLVNKADGELAETARRTAADYASAMRLIHPPSPEWEVPVRAVSALEGHGVGAVWDDVALFRSAREATGAWAQRRRDQVLAALWAEIDAGLLEHFRAARGMSGRLAQIEVEIAAGSRTPTKAARDLLAKFFSQPQLALDRPRGIRGRDEQQR
jgi:LAO/AO transport system kinase